jgi:DNA (cytosine-5)-methyltransferase 1
MRGADRAAYEADGRHFLYREYLRILKRFRPPVFVMENVKGILSSTVGGRHTFSHILADMKDAGYTLHSFVRTDVDGRDPDPAAFVVRAEDYGIPQARHRVIILGIREGLERGTAALRPQIVAPTTRDAIGDLPPIRSALSKQPDSVTAWLDVIRSFRPGRNKPTLAGTIEHSLRQLRELTLGDEFVPWSTRNSSADSRWLQENRHWILDDRIGGVTHHSARAHMASDLHRYFFASCFARTFGLSPRLRDFPRRLLPDHANAEVALGTSTFSDRFRVQLESQPSTTIVSHIRKDGHYYIHYDPTQCRSLTVREAARLQTFPDNYFFEGSRTEQYLQVGNAVPPLLALQLAEVVADILDQLAP